MKMLFFLMYRNVPNAMSQLRRMEAVTIWYAKTKTARLTSVGCAWDPGSLMGPHGKDNLMFDVFTKWNNPSTVVFVSVGLMVYWRIFFIFLVIFLFLILNTKWCGISFFF